MVSLDQFFAARAIEPEGPTQLLQVSTSDFISSFTEFIFYMSIHQDNKIILMLQVVSLLATAVSNL
jgi:hypothetical protein